MCRRVSIAITYLTVLGIVTPCRGQAPAASPRHPLDALTAEEIETAVALVEARDDDEPRRYPLVHLREPAKEKVLAWTVGQAMPRAARVVQRRGGRAFEAVVDLAASRVVEWRQLAGGHARLLSEEIASLTAIVTADERVRAALAARGVEDASHARCLPLSVGGPQAAGERRVRALCWEGADLNNLYSRPLGGLEILVDLDARAVVGFTDHGARPLATADHAYDEATAATRRRLRPFVEERPAGPSFSLDGGLVRWQSWSFHVRLDPRRGVVVSQVYYWDRGSRRSVLYQGSLAEVFVPYRFEADGSWLAWTAAEQGLRPTPLAVGLDCPETATLIDAVVADDRGRPRTVEGALAIFERQTGDPAWRHYGVWTTGDVESRPGVELVVRAIVTLGTYDYLLDWVFAQDGSIRVAVGVTGVLLGEGVTTVFLSEPTAGDDTAAGNLMAANIVAPHHEHWLSFRLDLDVDGPVNSFFEDHLERVRPPGGGLGVWKVTPRLLDREPQARLRHGPADSSLWRVVGTGRKTDVGQTPGFALEAPGSTLQGEPPHSMGFAYDLRVTPYDRDEILSPDDGADRSIRRTDLVLWYTLGFAHIPRLEDFPVIPTRFRSFELRPFHFFERNPAIDLRSTFASDRK